MLEKQRALVSPNRHKEFVVAGQFVEMQDRQDGPAPEEKKTKRG